MIYLRVIIVPRIVLKNRGVLCGDSINFFFLNGRRKGGEGRLIFREIKKDFLPC